MPDVLLIVDHNRELAQALAVYLRRQQFEALIADSGETALEMAHSAPQPAIVLVDPHFPETDPLVFLQEMKDILPQSPFIVYGPSDALETIMEAFHTNALTYIRKPVSGIELDFAMSHGIKGMLTALDGGVYLLETGISRQDAQRTAKAFDQVRKMVARIRKMVLDILYFTKSRELQYQKVDLHGLVESIAGVIQPSADHHNIIFTVTMPPDAVILEIDPDRLREALINFLENAVDACVSDQHKKSHHILFDTRATEDDHVCFEISDDGAGMDRETKEKMFTLFFSSKGSAGTGLGLFIANHVIGQHGGTIRVASEINKGTRFTIRVPRTRTSAKPKPPEFTGHTVR